MTHAAPRRRGGRTWMLPGLAVMAVTVSVFVGWISRSIVVDFVSWWPVWVVLIGVGFWSRGHKVGRFRQAGLVSIGSFLLGIAFIVGHFQAWSVMPSSIDHLVGTSDQVVTSAALSARVDQGNLVVSDRGGGDLYAVVPLRGGGEVGVPTAVERTQDGKVSVELTQVDDPGWYQFSGWDLALSPGPVWSLRLEGVIEADLRSFALESLQIEGEGEIDVGNVSASTPLSVSGNFVITFPDEVPVRVTGPAQVPDDWTHNDTGTASPESGQGWVISVADGSVVQIRTR